MDLGAAIAAFSTVDMIHCSILHSRTVVMDLLICRKQNCPNISSVIKRFRVKSIFCLLPLSPYHRFVLSASIAIIASKPKTAVQLWVLAAAAGTQTFQANNNLLQSCSVVSGGCGGTDCHYILPILVVRASSVSSPLFLSLSLCCAQPTTPLAAAAATPSVSQSPWYYTQQRWRRRRRLSVV
jgi:hypothetical protein